MTLDNCTILLGDGIKAGRVGGIDDNDLGSPGCLQARRDASRDDDEAHLANEEGILEDDMVV